MDKETTVPVSDENKNTKSSANFKNVLLLLISCILGMIVGIAIPVICIIAFKVTSSFSFLFIPIFIALFCILFGTSKMRIPAIILTAIFSLVGVYLTFYAGILYNFSEISVWSAIASQDIYMYIFLALGLFVAYELLVLADKKK